MASEMELTLRHPAASAAALAQGKAMAALIPSISLQMLEGARVVPGLCIAAWRRVRSVLLLTRGKAAALRSIAVDETSRTSVILLRILLKRLHGIQPRLVAQKANLAAMLDNHDGALLIADAALEAETSGLEVMDLAEVWAEWTGLPFVFAVWAVGPGVRRPGLTEALARSRSQGLAHLPQIIAHHAPGSHASQTAALSGYLGELLRYTLGPPEEASLNRFYAEAHALDLLPQPHPLRFYGAVPDRVEASMGECR